MQFLFFWAQTILYSYGMDVVNNLRVFKDLADSGYKINFEKFLEVSNSLNLKYASDYENYSSNSKLTRLIPIYNMLDEFRILFYYNENREMILNQFECLGLLEEMTEFEKKEYSKNPSYLNAFLVPLVVETRIENAVRVKINVDNKFGEIFFDLDDNYNICILKTTGIASEKTEEELISLIGLSVLNLLDQQTYNDLNEINESEETIKETSQYNDIQEVVQSNEDTEIEELENLKSYLLQEKMNNNKSTDNEENNHKHKKLMKK